VSTDKAALPFGLLLLVALNLVPLMGVLSWGWRSFDLIFLYWLENLIIGAFTVLRMLIRPYGHALELAFPLFIVPFFCLHYGMFCMGHGTFVVSLFGHAEVADEGLVAAALSVLRSPHMLAAVLALTLIQVADWIRDVRHRGLGADGVKELMTAPYRRIVVLHITILAGGFALTALNEPVAGLIILVIVKTASDVWHWRRDNAAEADAGLSPEALLTPERLEEMAEKYPEPMVTVNGEERRFASFAEMKRSKELRMARSLMRLVGAGKELKLMDAYLDHRIREESLEQKFSLPA
jgi:hypothetical protein